jgi:hypothetical protein
VAWASKFANALIVITDDLQTIHYLKTIKEPRLQDYEFKYRYGNRFAFLGNGTVKAQVTKDIAGLAPYVRSADTPWEIE